MRLDRPQPVHLPVSRLMDGYLTTQLLCAAAKLNIADELAGGPQTAEALARSTDANPDTLRRVLRCLAAEGIFDELPDGRFGLNASGTCLRSDAPDSYRAQVIIRGDFYYRAAAGLFEALKHGGVPFEHVYGADFFDYQARHPESGGAFQASMRDRARREGADVVAAYDFTGFDRLVDVGGGYGEMLAAILTSAPRLHGTLFDLPPVVECSREKLKEAGLSDRCEFVAGDFFKSVPPGGDAYLLAQIVHDWDDEVAIGILRRCREAIQPGGTLLLIERVLPERAVENPRALHMDVLMFILLGGRERTATEFERLLAASGFRLRRIVPARSADGVSVIEATLDSTSSSL